MALQVQMLAAPQRRWALGRCPAIGKRGSSHLCNQRFVSIARSHCQQARPFVATAVRARIRLRLMHPPNERSHQRPRQAHHLLHKEITRPPRWCHPHHQKQPSRRRRCQIMTPTPRNIARPSPHRQFPGRPRSASMPGRAWGLGHPVPMPAHKGHFLHHHPHQATCLAHHP